MEDTRVAFVWMVPKVPTFDNFYLLINIW